MKKPYEIDIAVLLIFFARDEQFAKVFEQVKASRPSRLYLYQDGPRPGRQDDAEGIRRCRGIADEIDWDCEVHTLYQEKNIGCDPSEFIAQKWMFETEEMGIVLEDDDVPSQSFFPFCKELLEKYRNDDRIHIICGMNNFDVNAHTENSYFFSRKGAIWGWASWKRVIDTWDETYAFMDDPDAVRLVRENSSSEAEFKRFMHTCARHRQSGRAHYESINGASRLLFGRVNIVPKCNMITNIGISTISTHSVNDIRKLPRKIQKLFNKKAYEISFPLQHPKYIMIDQTFDKRFETRRLHRFGLRAEGLVRSVMYR